MRQEENNACTASNGECMCVCCTPCIEGLAETIVVSRNYVREKNEAMNEKRFIWYGNELASKRLSFILFMLIFISSLR